MSADDIAEQITVTREIPKGTGHILFNAKVLMDNLDGIADRLAMLYAEAAIAPPSPWLDGDAPGSPEARLSDIAGAPAVRFAPRENVATWLWVVQSRIDGAWRTTVLPGERRMHILKADETAADVVAVSAVDRAGNVSAPAIMQRTR